MKDIESSLRKRLKSNTEETLSIVARYDLKPTIRNFDSRGFFLKDLKDKTVRVVSGGILHNDVIHIMPTKADIVVMFAEGMCLGWAEQIDFIDADDIMILKTKSIQPMPDIFDFHRTCPHLEEFGGFLEGDYWECGGCGTLIKANVDGA